MNMKQASKESAKACSAGCEHNH